MKKIKTVKKTASKVRKTVSKKTEAATKAKILVDGAVVVEGQKDLEENDKGQNKSKVVIKDGIVSVATQKDD